MFLYRVEWLTFRREMYRRVGYALYGSVLPLHTVPSDGDDVKLMHVFLGSEKKRKILNFCQHLTAPIKARFSTLTGFRQWKPSALASHATRSYRAHCFE